MRPIIYTTQRTGSTIVTDTLGNLCMQHSGYKSVLYEYFSIQPDFKVGYKKDNDIITIDEYERVSTKWYTYPMDELSYRLSLIDNDYNYMIKVMSDYPDYFKDIIESIVRTNFEVVYLERRDKVKQLISYLGTLQTNVSHYSQHPSNIYHSTKLMDKPIIYSIEQTNQFIDNLKKYKQFKDNNPSKYPTIYYEDFLELGGNEQSLIEILNLDITDYKPIEITTIPTPYSKKESEDHIINKKDWLNDKQRIIDVLQQI